MDNEFGEKLKKVRKGRQMTQEELGVKCGACAGAIRDWEKGLRLPNTYYLREMCIALHVSADYLLGVGRYEGRVKRKDSKGKR